jgi:glycosyltransferase involved in cell wall biosynthesis
MYEQLRKWPRWLYRRGIFHADAAIRLSELAPDNGQDLEARKEYVVPNGIDDLGRDVSMPRAARQITERAPMIVLFVAQLSESKGLWVLIEACAKLLAEGVPFRLDVIGNFESEDFERRTRTKVSALKLDGNVRFLGELIGAAKVAAFAEADALCHPTFNDSFGLIIVEAMSCCLPVVATRWSSIPTIVDEGKTGFLVEPHDADAVADRLACLARDAELRLQMGRSGREKFLREFTATRHLERMREVFLGVAAVSTAGEKACAGAPRVPSPLQVKNCKPSPKREVSIP